MEHFQDPVNRGLMKSPDAVGRVGTPGQGRFISIGLAIRDQRIVEARFDCNGCGVSVACGSMLTCLTEGKMVSESMGISVADLVEALDGLPIDKMYCAHESIGALRNAVAIANGVNKEDARNERTTA